MEAKESVMTIEQIRRFHGDVVAVAEAQDEATWPIALEEGKKIGIRKVVEWIDNNCIGVDMPTEDPEDYMGIQSIAWQAFLKNHNIEY